MPYVYTYLHSRYLVRTCLQPPPSPACCQVLPEELCPSALGRGCRRAPIDRSIMGFTSTMRELKKIRFDSSDCVGRSAQDDWCRSGRREGAVPLWFVLHSDSLCSYSRGCTSSSGKTTSGWSARRSRSPSRYRPLISVACCTYVCLYVVALRSHCRVAAH